jgi:hypothetical protein
MESEWMQQSRGERATGERGEEVLSSGFEVDKKGEMRGKGGKSETGHKSRTGEMDDGSRSEVRGFLDRRKMVSNDLGNFLKIAVRCQDGEPVLHGASGNPDIVGGNRGAGLLQRSADGCLTV